MASTIKRIPHRLCALFLAFVMIIGVLLSNGFIIAAQASFLPVTRAYIQTTIDTSSWEILAGVISYDSGMIGDQAEAKRVGADTLNQLAASEQPDDGSYDLVDANLGKVGGNQGNNLVLCFPGGVSASGVGDNSTAEDTARAQLVRNSLIYDLNAAFKFVYGDQYGTYSPQVTSGDSDTIEARIDKYAQDLSAFLSCIPGSVGTTFGPDGKSQIVATQEPKNPVDADIPESVRGQYYVTIKRTYDDGTSDTRTFQYRMLKGYGVEGTGLPVRNNDDTKYIHWATLATEAFVNYSADEKLQVTAENVYESTPTMGERVLSSIFGTLANFIANTLGLWNFDELIFNGGIRGTQSFVGGIFPTNWQSVIWTFFYISEIIAIIMLLYAIIYNVGKKALSTIDPVARASAIEQIKYLFIVAFLLAIIPFVIPMLINASAELTGIFHDVLGGKTAEERFKKLAQNSGGLGSALTYLVYLGALLYFNVFYVSRALAISLLIILAPIFIAMMALNENKRQLTIAWFREFCANLFIQPLQALMLSFILLVPDTGRNIDSIVMAYVMIPMTNLLRQMFFSGAGGMTDRVGVQGKNAGVRTIKFAGGLAKSVAGGAIGGLAAGAKKSKADGGSEGASGGGSEETGSAGRAGSTGGASGGASSRAGGASNNSSSSGGSDSGSGSSSGSGAGSGSSKTSKAGGTVNSSGGADSPKPGIRSKLSDFGAGVKDKLWGGGGDGSLTTGQRVVRGAVGAAAIAGGGFLGGLAGGGNFLSRTFTGTDALSAGPLRQLSQNVSGAGFGIGKEAVSGRAKNASGTGGETTGSANGSASSDDVRVRVGAGAFGGNGMPGGPSGIGGSGGTGDAGAQDGGNGSDDSSMDGDSGLNHSLTNRYAQTLQGNTKYNDPGTAYSNGHLTKRSNGDGTNTFYANRDHARKLGISAGSAGGTGSDRQFSATYRADSLNNDDRTRLEAIRNIWENGSPQERQALQAMGITGFTAYDESVNGEDQMVKADLTFNSDKAMQNFGIGYGRNGYSVKTDGDSAPNLVPDVVSKLNTPQASSAYATAQLENQGFASKANDAEGTVTFTASAKQFQDIPVPENLAPYFSKAQVGKNGQMSATIPQDELAKSYGGITASDSTIRMREEAASAMPGQITPTTTPMAAPKMMSAGALNGMNSLTGQGFAVQPDASGENYVISGTNLHEAQVPAGIAPHIANAMPGDNGVASVTVPKAAFSQAYNGNEINGQLNPDSIKMAPAGVFAGAQSLTSQGATVTGHEGTYTVQIPDPKALNVPAPVAEHFAQTMSFDDSSGKYVAQCPEAMFNAYTAGGNGGAAPVFVPLGQYMDAGKLGGTTPPMNPDTGTVIPPTVSPMSSADVGSGTTPTSPVHTNIGTITPSMDTGVGEPPAPADTGTGSKGDLTDKGPQAYNPNIAPPPKDRS